MREWQWSEAKAGLHTGQRGEGCQILGHGWELDLGAEHTIKYIHIVKLYTWNLHNAISQCTPNKFNLKLRHDGFIIWTWSAGSAGYNHMTNYKVVLILFFQ